jgi:hypothetical protein
MKKGKGAGKGRGSGGKAKEGRKEPKKVASFSPLPGWQTPLLKIKSTLLKSQGKGRLGMVV